MTTAQREALDFAAKVAAAHRDGARQRIRRCLDASGVPTDSFDHALATLQRHACIALHFHPDRLTTAHTTVADGLLQDGIYRTQWETGISSGSLSAHDGGHRDLWEHRLFGGSYQREGVQTNERPRYGSLEIVRFPDGPMPRFGSCYFLLKPEVSSRATFTFMGSEDPVAAERLGTIDRMEPVIAALVEEIASGAVSRPAWPPFTAPTLGVSGLTIERLVSLMERLAEPRTPIDGGAPGRVLDTNIESQVHDEVRLDRDVALCVADSSFRETQIGTTLRAISERYAIPLEWHGGFWMRAKDVPDDFRGPTMPSLAHRIARDGRIDAAIIGEAAASLTMNPELWTDRGAPHDVPEELKQLWHTVVHHGLQ